MFGVVRQKLEYTNLMKRNWMQKTISGYFIGYLEKSKGYMFYCLTHNTRIVETGNVWFIENGKTSGSEASQNVEIKEVRVQVPLTSIFTSRIVVPHVDEVHNDQEEQINDPKINNELIVEQPQKIVLKRSQRKKQSYVVYLHESKMN